MRKVSPERYYFVVYDGALTLKKSKMALNSFCDKTLLNEACKKNLSDVTSCLAM